MEKAWLLLALLLLSGHPASFTRAQNTNAEVSAAPAAELINGIDDITASGVTTVRRWKGCVEWRTYQESSTACKRPWARSGQPHKQPIL
eukprot:1157243-Pelagomonas_calceolata.AAC.4